MPDQIISNGSIYHLQECGTMTTKLPLGIYTVMLHPTRGYYLQKIADDFQLPSKIYNHPKDLINRWLKAWNNCDKNMGIFLSGQKGGGKTITAELFCNIAKMPVICLSTPYTDDNFKEFISNEVFRECIIFIDEFEKTYSQDSDRPDSIEHLLGLMDGAFNTRLCFLLTSNSDRISEFITNRPGRVKYRKEYGYLKPSEAIEIVQDRLKNMEHEESVYRMIDFYGNCTMDILTKVIDDMNLFNEDAITCSSYMNLKPDATDYDVFVDFSGIEGIINFNPLYSQLLTNGWSGYIRLDDTTKVDLCKKLTKLVNDKGHKQYTVEDCMREFSNQSYLNIEEEELEREDNGTYTYEQTFYRLCGIPIKGKVIFKPKSSFSTTRYVF